MTTGNGAYDTTDKSVKGAACIKTDSTLIVNGGELWLKSTGSGGKGINVDMDANFNGGSVYVVTTGGQYKINNDSSSPKGIKVDGNINISGGRIWVRTSGYNGEGIETKKQMTITGGYVYAQGQHNDGLDANGNCYIKGGTIFAICSGTPEVAIDANTEGGYKLYVTGGTIVAVGGVENGSSLSQSCYQASSWSASTWYEQWSRRLALTLKMKLSDFEVLS